MYAYLAADESDQLWTAVDVAGLVMVSILMLGLILKFHENIKLMFGLDFETNACFTI